MPTITSLLILTEISVNAYSSKDLAPNLWFCLTPNRAIIVMDGKGSLQYSGLSHAWPLDLHWPSTLPYCHPIPRPIFPLLEFLPSLKLWNQIHHFYQLSLCIPPVTKTSLSCKGDFLSYQVEKPIHRIHLRARLPQCLDMVSWDPVSFHFCLLNSSAASSGWKIMYRSGLHAVCCTIEEEKEKSLTWNFQKRSSSLSLMHTGPDVHPRTRDIGSWLDYCELISRSLTHVSKPLEPGLGLAPPTTYRLHEV